MTRRFELDTRMMMGSTINGRQMQMDRIDQRVGLGDTEIWEFINNSPMHHPMHVPGAQFQVLSRNGKAPPANEVGLKDTVLVYSDEVVRMITRFPPTTRRVAPPRSPPKRLPSRSLVTSCYTAALVRHIADTCTCFNGPQDKGDPLRQTGWVRRQEEPNMPKRTTTRPTVLLLAGMTLLVGPTAAATPAEQYSASCMACHGDDGSGVMPGVPDLSERDGALAKADEVLFQAIWAGSGDPASGVAMPPKGGNPDLSESDVQGLIDYMRSEFLD